MAFSYYKSVTIDHTQLNVLGAVNLSNYPVTINVTDADLATIAHGGFVQSISGYDIRPYADSGLSSALDFELVSYDSTTGALLMFVRVPTVSHTVDTVFYLAFGDASLVSDGTSTTTWNSNFLGVWHLHNSLNDSTANGNTASTVYNFSATGPFGQALRLVGTSDADMGDPAIFDNLYTTGYTYSLWGNVDSNSSSECFLSKGANRILAQSAAAFNGSLHGVEMGWSGSDALPDAGATVITAGTWYALSSSFRNSTSTLAILLNGAVLDQKTATGSAASDVGSSFKLGTLNGSFSALIGYAAEVRLSKIDRPINWYQADYNNQVAGSTFLTFGAKIAVSVPSVGLWLPQLHVSGQSPNLMIPSGMH